MEALHALSEFSAEPDPREDERAGAESASKRARTAAHAEQARATRDEVARRLAAADEAGNGADEALDEASVKRLVLALEKRVTENVRMRAKFATEPNRFLKSEIELFAELKKLHALATSPALIPPFVRTGALTTILSLLAHENTDISVEVIDLLSELTDADLLVELRELAAANTLIAALLESGGVETIVEHISRLDEADADEAEAVHKSLLIVENLLEAQPARVAELLVGKTALLPWLLQRIKPRAFDANKLYASELLSILLQASSVVREQLGAADGMEALLLAVAPFKRKEPAGGEEEELCENLFDSICSALLFPANQTLFLKAEGVELMILALREGRFGARGALRTLDFAAQRNAVVAERIVDSRGLGALFPYVGRAASLPLAHLKSRAERETAQREDDEHIISLLASLCHELDGRYRQRLLGKFVEGGHDKVAALVATRQAYAARVAAFEARARVEADGGGDDDDDDGELFLGRLEAGLLTVQLATTVLAYLIVSGDPSLSRTTLLLLHEAGVGVDGVAASLRELRESMGEAQVGVAVTNNRLKMDALCARFEQLSARLVRRQAPSGAGGATVAGPTGEGEHQ